MSSGAANDTRLTPAIVHRILVVEDDPESASFLKTLLEQKGYDPVIARDAGQAHSMFTMRKPDFVILDLILPGVETGFEVCERLKGLEKYVPILVLTAIDMDDSRNLAQRVGADDYLTKPYDPDDLLARIPALAQKLWEQSRADDVKEGNQPVRFSCRCGKRFKVSHQHRGKTLTCPNCGEPVLVPRHD